MIAHTSARVSRVLGIFALLSVSLASIGCRSNAPVLERTAYEGPSITIDRSGATYLLRVESPSPGWSVTLDQVEPSFGQSTLTVTSRRPDPSYMYPQVMVTQELLTTVDVRTPIDVYARVLDFASSPNAGAYRFVGSSRADEAPRSP